MLIKDYKRIKKNDIKQWLLGGNAKIYGIILIVFLAAVIFVFRTVGSMFNEQPAVQEEPSNEETTTSYVAENMSYKVAVNKSQNFITIYKVDNNGDFTNAVKVYRCSVGKDVPTGDTRITDKYQWRKIDENAYGHYASKLDNSACIYSVPFYAQDNSKLNVEAYNNLGNQAKIGSIYLASAEAKWIYENCGTRSYVTIYEDSDEKPAINLEEFSTVSSGTQFDPTDETSAANPYASNTKIAWMSGVDDCSTPLNQPFDRWAGVYAVDINRNDITSKITITGDLDVTTPGTYTLIYHLSDNFGTNLAYYRYVTVTEDGSGKGNNTSEDNSNDTKSNTEQSQSNVNNGGSSNSLNQQSGNQQTNGVTLDNNSNLNQNASGGTQYNGAPNINNQQETTTSFHVNH